MMRASGSRVGLLAPLFTAGLCALSACSIEVPPSVPGAPERRAVVVPDSSGGEHGGVVPPEECSAICPPPRAGEALDQCHGTRLDPVMAAHRKALGENVSNWVLCYYEDG
ncbi:MAG TPA: hypothetical protein VL400_21215 [Polyangiaceae bacterium]|jgi:hypothetical protein|nr:hypothetical protein [Polyangiaceae bacterium]